MYIPCIHLLSIQERMSLRIRYVLFCVQILGVIIFFYFASRHLWYCQPYGILVEKIVQPEHTAQKALVYKLYTAL